MPGGFKSNKSKTGTANVNEQWRRAREAAGSDAPMVEPPVEQEPMIAEHLGACSAQSSARSRRSEQTHMLPPALTDVVALPPSPSLYQSSSSLAHEVAAGQASSSRVTGAKQRRRSASPASSRPPSKARRTSAPPKRAQTASPSPDSPPFVSSPAISSLPAPDPPSALQPRDSPPPLRNAITAKTVLGHFVEVPWASWGDDFANSTEYTRGMVVGFDGRKPPAFIIKFPVAGYVPLRASWAQLFDDAPFNDAILRMQVPLSNSTTLTPRPSGKPPSSADCWDMRRAEWVQCDGHAVTAITTSCTSIKGRSRRAAQLRVRMSGNTMGCCRASRHGASRTHPSTSRRRTVRWWTRGTRTSDVIERCSHALFDVC